MRKRLIGLILFGFWNCGLLHLVSARPVNARQAEAAESFDENTKLRLAAGQHEIVFVLISAKRFPEVLPEYRNILDLNLQDENEKLVVQEAWLIAQELSKLGQYSLAHEVVDETLARMQRSESKFSLVMQKGKLFKDQGRLLEAIETFRKAQQLQ